MTASKQASGGGLKWIVAAATFGLASALLWIRHEESVPASEPALRVAGRDAGAASLDAATAALDSAAVPGAAAPAAVAPAEDALTDAALIRLAREQFGADCDEISEREPPRASHFDFNCLNGTQLRVYVAAGGPPRIGPRH